MLGCPTREYTTLAVTESDCLQILRSQPLSPHHHKLTVLPTTAPANLVAKMRGGWSLRNLTRAPACCRVTLYRGNHAGLQLLLRSLSPGASRASTCRMLTAWQNSAAAEPRSHRGRPEPLPLPAPGRSQFAAAVPNLGVAVGEKVRLLRRTMVKIRTQARKNGARSVPAPRNCGFSGSSASYPLANGTRRHAQRRSRPTTASFFGHLPGPHPPPKKKPQRSATLSDTPTPPRNR